MDWTKCSQGEVATFQCIPLLFTNIIFWALIVAGVFTLYFIIISGFKLILSAGEPKRFEDARHTLQYAITGLIVILLSFTIVALIAATTGAACINKFGFGNC